MLRYNIVYTYTISVPGAGNIGVLCDECLSMVPQVTATQLLVFLLFRPSFVILHLFLRISTGSRLIFGLNLKYLLLLTRLSMDLLLLILKIFFKVASRQRILGLQKKNLLDVRAFNINSYGRRAFSVSTPPLWNSLPQHIRDAGSLDIFKRQLKTVLFRRAFLNR